MASIAGNLDAAVRAVAPNIKGVKITDRTDRSTWSVVFVGEPTQAERDAVQSVIDAFVVEDGML